MNDVDQLVNAMLVMVFAAVMIVVGHMYMENRALKLPDHPGSTDGFDADFAALTGRLPRDACYSRRLRS